MEKQYCSSQFNYVSFAAVVLCAHSTSRFTSIFLLRLVQSYNYIRNISLICDNSVTTQNL